MRLFIFFDHTFPFKRIKCQSKGFDVASAIGSGLSFVGGLLTNSTNKKIAREQMAQQERLFNSQMDYTKAAEQRQYDYADKVWQREIDYNDPAAQRARYEAAGLNPALMMQGQNAAIGSAESVSAPSAPGAPSPVSYQVQDPVTPAVQTFLQGRLMAAQAAKMEEDAYQTSIDNRTRETSNILNLAKQRQELENLIKDGKLSDKQRAYFQKQIEVLDDQLAVATASFDARVKQQGQQNWLDQSQIDLLQEEIVSRKVANLFAMIEHQIGIKVSEATISNLSSQALLNGALKGKTILESLPLKRGTPEYEAAQDLIRSQAEKNDNVWFFPGSVVRKSRQGWRKFAKKFFGK